jgi:AraC family transcriptional regulator
MWHTMTKCSQTAGVSSSALFSEDALGTPEVHERHFEQSDLRSDLTPASSAGCDLFSATVQISPIELVKRHCMERYGIVTESIYAPTRSRIEIRYDAPAHLLVLYEDGVRREGETSIDGLPPSTLRNFANKLTFVPAGHSYREWHEISAANA